MGSVAGWDLKRRWVADAFAALERAGYHVASAYTAVKNPKQTGFAFRDRLWEGADLVGIGVASFGHINGVHVQNVDTWERYAASLTAGELPLGRAYRPSVDERLVREFILQIKRGAVRPPYFEGKYGRTRSCGSGRSLRRCSRRLSRRAVPRPDRAHARGADARGFAAPSILPARTYGHQIYVVVRAASFQLL